MHLAQRDAGLRLVSGPFGRSLFKRYRCLLFDIRSHPSCHDRPRWPGRRSFGLLRLGDRFLHFCIWHLSRGQRFTRPTFDLRTPRFEALLLRFEALPLRFAFCLSGPCELLLLSQLSFLRRPGRLFFGGQFPSRFQGCPFLPDFGQRELYLFTLKPQLLSFPCRKLNFRRLARERFRLIGDHHGLVFELDTRTREVCKIVPPEVLVLGFDLGVLGHASAGHVKDLHAEVVNGAR